MTISSTTVRNQYNGDGSTVNFPYQFTIIQSPDILVILTDSNGVDTVQTITSQYTVSGAGVDGGGIVTFITAPATGHRVTLVRDAQALQPEHYVENDAFPASAHELALDRVTTVSQTALEECSRALQVPYGTLASSFTNLLPPITLANAGGVIALNNTATAFEFLAITPGNVTGPTSSTDKSVPVFSGTSGNVLEDTSVTIDSSGAVTINPTTGRAIDIKPYGNGAGQTGEVRLYEIPPNGTNYVGLKAPDNISVNVTFTLPATDGAPGQLLSTDGSGNMAWSNPEGIGWRVVTSNTTLVANNNYIANNSSSITLTLPTTAAIGSVIEIVGVGSDIWTIAQNAGQSILFVDTASTTGVSGSATPLEPRASLKLVCYSVDSGFAIASASGNINLI